MPLVNIRKQAQGYTALDVHRKAINEIINELNGLGGEAEYSYLVNEFGNLSLYRTISGVTEFIGEVGGGYTDQLVFTKPLGGVRAYKDPYEYFMLRQEVSGDGLGAVFGNLDTASGNYFATSEQGGLWAVHRTEVMISQLLGTQATSNYVESTLFRFEITSDQVKPYGIQALYLVGSTDVDFTDVPFNTRIFNQAGTEVLSDIQLTELWRVEPQPEGNPKFKLSSAGGVVTLPMSQPFPMDSAETYLVEYEFATPIRLGGVATNDLKLEMFGRRLEYFPVNYTGEVFFRSSNFVATSGNNYKVDTSLSSVTATIHESARSVVVGDYDHTWDNARPFILSTVAGDITFGTSQKGKTFQVVKQGSGYRVYRIGDSLEISIP